MARELVALLAPDAGALAAAVALDLVLGDPVYGAHPIRLMGRTLAAFEQLLRRIGADGYGGGIALFLVLAAVWTGGVSSLVFLANRIDPRAAWVLQVFLVYSFIALGDLLRHGWRVERAARAGDLAGARAAIARLVGRDIDRMDGAACRRAAIESLSENLADGFTSALFWYAIAGMPGLVLFKVVSTMDSMVGYKTTRYLKFGWCGARLDDVMNFIPARLTWLLIGVTALVIPGCSSVKALRVGREQHAILPGPNSGWSEAAAAGAIQRRIAGPIWLNGQLVNERWIGAADDPPLETAADFTRGAALVAAAGLAFAAMTVLLIRTIS